MVVDRYIASELEMVALGRELAKLWKAGDIVLLYGDLGAGKTTLVRGVMEGLGWEGAVRSPTFNLMQVYPTKIPVVHADLYRVASAAGIGLEEYFDDHLILIEWPDRLGGLVEEQECWRVHVEFARDGRRIESFLPSKYPLATPDEIAGIPSDWPYEYDKLLELFPTLNPEYYPAEFLFQWRDFFDYLSPNAQRALMERYYLAAIELDSATRNGGGIELLDTYVDFRFLEAITNEGKEFPEYQAIHRAREAFKHLWVETHKVSIEEFESWFPQEPT
jgi:tRNA threonylcarbamoyladenosine biosynthesis protein TsaE